jgi:hypothetical protein
VTHLSTSMTNLYAAEPPNRALNCDCLWQVCTCMMQSSDRADVTGNRRVLRDEHTVRKHPIADVRLPRSTHAARLRAMGRTYDRLDRRLREWVERQPVFFVATAPLSGVLRR